jgi:HPt (histidine-containing phosphotransfer) domain-containing protein
MKKDDTLLICDVSEDALKRFQEETKGQGAVEVVSNGFEAVKAAVCLLPIVWFIVLTHQ